MKTRYHWNCLLTGLLLFCGQLLFGGALDDFEKDFESIMTNFDDARNSRDNSRFASEYEKNFAKLEYDARKIQEVVTKLGIEDINLPQEVVNLRQVYLDRKSGRSGSGKIGYASGRWNPSQKIRQQIAMLRAMDFSYEERSFNKASTEKDEFEEYETLLNYCSAQMKNALFSRWNNQWKKDFEKKLARLTYLGTRIQEKMTRQNINLPLATETQAFADVYKKADLSKKEKSIINGKTNTSDDQEDSRILQKKGEFEKDLGMALDRLREYIVQLKDRNFVFDEVKAKQRAEEKKETKSELKEFKTEENDENNSYVTMSKEELCKLLQEERDKIYKDDKRIGGLSAETIEAYRKTLTSDQIKHLGSVTKKYSDRGYSKEDASSNAVMEIHGYYRNRFGGYTKEEIIKILEKINKSKDGK